MKKYIPSEIELKWQEKWRAGKIFSPDLKNAKKPYYALMMFPYPSAEGLHVGNMYPFTAVDISARFKRMQGFDVFEPIGLDSFGIHSENYALKIGKNPSQLTDITGARFYKQLMIIGNSYDWTKTLETHKPEYYRWTQWIFIQMFKEGLAFQKEANVNWCPKDLTVLADEQVIAGRCERCSSLVEQKKLKQWFFKITQYSDKLLENLKTDTWSERIRLIQQNWIGKKEGINITYNIAGSKEKITVFTTRPDTNFGATFLVLGPEHPLIYKITKDKYLDTVKNYIDSSLKKTEQERVEGGKKKTGAFTGSYATNNLTGGKLPIWVSDFVLGNVGTGAVVGVPGHDMRDFEFAKAFDLPIIRVIVGGDGDKSKVTNPEQVQEKEGIMVNSGFLNGMDNHKAKIAIMDYLEERGWGKRVVNYHLRDWLISRQRYWGPPIPVIYCPQCNVVPVPDDQLPVLLPKTDNFRPTGTGKSPLASIPDFVKTSCPNCKGPAQRETDVSDNFLDSAWYFFRYPSSDNDEAIFGKEITKKWLPIDLYIGGFEHALLHLMYTRFITLVFKKLDLIDFEEPFKKFVDNGHIISEGIKMSKSKGNVINPDEYIKEYGADTLRMYLMFLAPLTEGGDFRKDAIEGIYRFLQKVWDISQNIEIKKATKEELVILNKTIKAVTEDLESHIHFNTAIARLMEMINFLNKQKTADQDTIKTILKLLAPFAPHITEELWLLLYKTSGDENWSIHKQQWPKFDENYLEEELATIVIQVNGKVRDTVVLDKERSQNEIERIALESDKIKKFITSRPKKTIYIKNKLINFVA